MSVTLFEDNTFSNDFEKNEYNLVNLTWDGTNGKIRGEGILKKYYIKLSDWRLLNKF